LRPARLGGFALLVLFIFLVSLQHVSCRQPARDPATKRVRVIYLGDAWGANSPYQYMKMDPLLMPTPVPASTGHMGGIPNISRYIRIYVPRTYNRLVESYDVIILSDTVRSYYRTYHIQWFADAVEKGGRGLVMVGGREIQWGDWPGSPVEKVLPVNWVPLETYEQPFRAIPVGPKDEFLSALPWETMLPYSGMNVATVKQGARIYLKADAKDLPLLVFWEYGEGASVAHTPDWTPAWGGANFWGWKYYPDFVSDILYLVAGIHIPDNPDLIHNIREQYYGFQIQWSLVIGMLDFVEEFGANVAPLDRKLSEISDLKRQASQAYIEQDYEQTLSKIKDAREGLREALELAMEIKDRALVWIYVTEAMAVTGTSLLCGVAIWFLMVRRVLYREVSTTRLRSEE